VSAVTFHLGAETVRASGMFAVRWGRPSLARILARLLRFPREGPAVPVRVEIERMGDREVWRRWFAGRLYVTRQTRRGRIRIERIAALEIRYRLRASAHEVHYVQEAVSIRAGRLAVPLPRCLPPMVSAWAAGPDGDRFFVAVTVRAPLVGPLLSYAGYVIEEG
jgi:Domain of unknown function (DUF4166)